MKNPAYTREWFIDNSAIHPLPHIHNIFEADCRAMSTACPLESGNLPLRSSYPQKIFLLETIFGQYGSLKT
jgi:hypothetical protein